MAEEWPRVRFVGHWTPERDDVSDSLRSRALASEIRASGADILLVCLGKPRQERWINEYGLLTGAGALLAFGAAVDFLAGTVSRAPVWVSQSGGEWAWRLMREPRRLARRYLVDGPPAYLAVRRASRLLQSDMRQVSS
jgi:exopolysaccharide biosynthesis WecB/TagA/CpsF family protein